MRLAVEHPERVERLVILNTGSGAGRAPSPAWLRFRELVRRVGPELTASRLVQASCVSAARRSRPPRPTTRRSPSPESKAGALAFPELVPTELDHPSAAGDAARPRGARSLGEADARPLLRLRPRLLAGACRAPRAATSRVRSRPRSSRAPGHFLQEDKGEEVAERIVRFLA